MNVNNTKVYLFSRSGDTILTYIDRGRFTGIDGGAIAAETPTATALRTIRRVTGLDLIADALNLECIVGIPAENNGGVISNTHYFTAVVGKDQVGPQQGGPALSWVNVKQVEEEPELFVESDITRFVVKKAMARYNFSTGAVTRIPFRPSKPY